MQVQKKRIDALDLLKSLAIFLVIWGHVIQHCLTSNHVEEPVYRFIYSFHMPLFMVLCGFFSQSSMNMNFGDMMKKKTVSILYPSILWGGQIFLIVSGVHIVKGENSFDYYSLLCNLLWSSYWFLKAVFLCYIIAWIGVNSKLLSPLWIMGTCLLVQFWPHFNMPLMYPCFMIGMFLKQVIDNDWFVRFRYLYLFCFVICLLFWTKDFAGDYEQTLQSFSPFTIEFTILLLFRCYKLIMGASASFFLIAIVRKYLWGFDANQTKIGCWAAQCGVYSMGVYLIQTLLLEYFLKKFVSFDGLNIWAFNIVIAPLFSMLVLMICVAAIRLLNCKRRLSLLLFGTNYVK